MASTADSGIYGIWQYAEESGVVIVTKDIDYVRLSEERGLPPKVIRITLGNCSRQATADLLRERYADVVAFLTDENSGLLLLP